MWKILKTLGHTRDTQVEKTNHNLRWQLMKEKTTRKTTTTITIVTQCQSPLLNAQSNLQIIMADMSGKLSANTYSPSLFLPLTLNQKKKKLNESIHIPLLIRFICSDDGSVRCGVVWCASCEPTSFWIVNLEEKVYNIKRSAHKNHHRTKRRLKPVKKITTKIASMKENCYENGKGDKR